ncbi:MAG: L,D-transpeptidase family protein [Verrucomicrobiota bacterium]
MRTFSQFVIPASGIVLALASVSCKVTAPLANLLPARQVLHEWHDDGGPGKVTVRISLKDQIAEFKRGGRDIGWCYVATGKEGHGTAAGSYRITEKIVDKHSNRYGWIEDEFGNVVNGDAKPSTRRKKGEVYVPAPMPYWMRLTSYGIGMHGGIIPEPGKTASHGCIRLPKEFVPKVFDSVQVGTPVTITYARSNIMKQREEPAVERLDLPSAPFAN